MKTTPRLAVVFGAVASVCCSAALAAPAAREPIVYPHPMITEVLFNVPPGEAGDANADGERNATGDEFIELINPHRKPINLKGYTLTDRNPKGPTQLRFVFPDFILRPGALVVVFNGYNAKIPGPVGTDARRPEAPNRNFHNAWIFQMQTQPKQALNNRGDFVLLTSPAGEPIDAVVWGFPTRIPPPETHRVKTIGANVKGSVQRISPRGELAPHLTINEKLFSPGFMPDKTTPEE